MRIQIKHEHINWDRIDYLCSRLVRSAGVVALTIAAWWAVFEILSKAFGGV